MRLNRKTLIIFGLMTICAVSILYATSQMILLNSYITLEKNDTQKNVERALSAVYAELNNLDSFVYDWAAWDDTYSFIQDANEDYIESNLVDETFIGSELNLMLFINSSGDVVFGKAFDLENEEETPLPESLVEQLSPNSVLLQHRGTNSTLTGLLLLPEDPMLIVSRPIITSEDEGPILGSLIMGYFFDSTRINDLADRTHLSLNFHLFNDSHLPMDFQEALPSLSEETPIFVESINSDTIAGYTMIEDIYGEPGLVLRVDLPRSIYQQGQTSIFYFVLFLMTTGITVSILVVLLLEKTLVSRLAQLNADINHIRSHGDPSERVTVSGKDEISDLADEINGMLTTLEQSQNKLQLLNEKLGVVGSLTRHDARNKLSVIANNLYLATKTAANDSSALEYLAKIESTIGQLEKIFDFAMTYEKLGVEELSYVNVEKSIKEATMILGLDNVKLVNDCNGWTVRADSLLRQLFYNLIDNSLRHGEKISQIRVHCEVKEEQLMLVYEDDGSGISKTEKEKIFEEGYGKGTGYGLYLIKKICEAYGWTIQETGRAGKGAKFTITIPRLNKNEEPNFRLQ